MKYNKRTPQTFDSARAEVLEGVRFSAGLGMPNRPISYEVDPDVQARIEREITDELAKCAADRGRTIDGLRVRCHYNRIENSVEITFWKNGEQLAIDEVTTMVTGLYVNTVTLVPGDG
jgi:hypothetical protein